MKWAAAIAEVGCWWLVTIAVWLLTLSSVTLPDLCTAAGCGALCALAARAARRAMADVWRPRPVWALWLAPLVIAVPADCVRVLMLAARRLPSRDEVGRLRAVVLPVGETEPAGSTRRALAAAAISATPGNLVVDSDPERGELVIHSLVDGWPRLDRVVRR